MCIPFSLKGKIATWPDIRWLVMIIMIINPLILILGQSYPFLAPPFLFSSFKFSSIQAKYQDTIISPLFLGICWSFSTFYYSHSRSFTPSFS